MPLVLCVKTKKTQMLKKANYITKTTLCTKKSQLQRIKNQFSSSFIIRFPSKFSTHLW